MRNLVVRTARALADSPLHTPIRFFTRHRILPSRGFRSAPLRARRFRVDVPGGSSFLYEAGGQDILGQLLYWGGLHGYEWDTFRTFLPLAKRSLHFVDVGANTGIYTLAACAVGGARVSAIEADPDVSQHLRRHIALNDLSSRVTVHSVVAFDRAGTVTFSRGEDSTTRGIGHVADDRELGDWQRMELPAARLDDLIDAEDVDLVKIDVEASEAAVLRGMARILDRCRPTIVLEILPWAAESAPAILEPLGYRFQQITPTGLEPCINPLLVTTSSGPSNFLCTPELAQH